MTRSSRTTIPQPAPKSVEQCFMERHEAMERARYWKARGMMDDCKSNVRIAWQWHYIGRDRHDGLYA